MKFSDLLTMSVNNLFRRKLRTFLTVLGVVIGTASIVVMVSIGIGLKEFTIKQYSSYGSLTAIQVYNYNNGNSSDKKNPEAQYNTATGKEGYVLDCMKNDGTTVSFTPYTSDAYCIYDNTTGQVELKENSLKLCTVSGTSDKEPGELVRIDLYIWLEGCDEDCTANLCSQTLKNLAVSFAGLHE